MRQQTMRQLNLLDNVVPKQAPVKLNSDGYSIAGCSIIYAPKGQAGEYAPLATNPYRGCGHKCVYCYCPSVLRMSRDEFDNEVKPRPNFIKLLTKDAGKYEVAGITNQVMLSFTTDPYCPLDVKEQLTRQTIQALQTHGLGVCTLTKGGSRALRDIDLFRPDRDAFASTLTSLDPDVSRRWEAEAALPADRLATLKTFHDAGIFTWVSLEPVLDTAAALEIIKATHEFVDLYKVGRINYHRLTKETDWADFARRVTDLLNRLGVRHYIKADLQPYLPAGYHNPKRIPQHN